jgi:hypothetical protein
MFVQIQHDNQIKTDFIHFSREQDWHDREVW